MFEVYATRYDSAGIIAHLIPARSLVFSMPLSAHGEASFSATVEPGRSSWRSSLSGPRSGILIAETQGSGTAVPLWAGRLKSEQEQGARSFGFTCSEWGSAFSWFPAPVDVWDTLDTDTYVDIVNRVQAVPGPNLAIDTGGNAPGAGRTRFEVAASEAKDAEAALRDVGQAYGGPEWYYTVGGRLDAPRRQLILGDQLGLREPKTVLEYVEDTVERQQGQAPPQIALLSSLFPGEGPQSVPARRGGNVIDCRRTQDSDAACTVVVAVGGGPEGAQIRATAVAGTLIDQGWPRITRTVSFPEVYDVNVLQAKANAELQASAGLLTGYSLVTQGSEPNWRQVPRGSMVRAELDTDVYAGRRPYQAVTRVQNITVAVPDDGGKEQVRWDLAEILEVN